MADRIIRIAVDAMGGDHFPDTLVQGSIEAVESFSDVVITLVGDEKVVSDSLREHLRLHTASDLTKDELSGRLKVVHSEQVIEMHEPPARAIRSKKHSSIVIANKLCKSGDVEAVISAGNTGAAMASSLFHMGRLTGVIRPAIMAIFPSKSNIVAVLDVGANTDSKPEQLYQFGIMASIFTSKVLGYKNPRVSLLSIGEEKSKGNELTTSTYKLLDASDLNFIGNIEGRDIFEGVADVVVCDGFVGNVLLKFGESAFGFVTHKLKEQISGNLLSKLGAYLLKPAFLKIKEDMSPEDYGGAPLLGVDGISIICHGNSTPKAIKNAVRVARQLVLEEMNDQIKSELAKTNSG